MTEFDRLRERITIDPLDLDTELIGLPVLVRDIGENLAAAIAERDHLKELLDRARGEAGRQLRGGPREHVAGERVRPVPNPPREWKQPSEAQIATELPLMPRVIEAQERLGEVDLMVMRWKELHNAARQKSASIQQYVELMKAGYLTPDAAHVQRRREIDAVRKEKYSGTN